MQRKNGIISFLDIDKVKSESGLQGGKSAIRHLWTEWRIKKNSSLKSFQYSKKRIIKKFKKTITLNEKWTY